MYVAFGYVTLASGCAGNVNSGGCQLPAKLPQMIGTPIPTQPIPAGANVIGTFTVIVDITIDSGGKVDNSTIGSSSGNVIIDQAAATIVRQSTYSPGAAGCGNNAAPNTLAVSVTFSSN